MFRSLFNFFLFTSLYISLCAILMVWQTNVLLQLEYAQAAYYAFVGCATICSYNFHWYLTPADYSSSERIMWGLRHRSLQLALCGLGALGALYFFWQLRAHWLPLSGAALLTFLYSAPKLPQRGFVWLRRIAIGKTLFLTFVWTYVTTLLPVLVAGAPVNAPALYFTLHRFFLVYAICILFDYRDLESDKKEGIRSLITFLPLPALNRVYALSLLLAALCAGLLLPYTTPAVMATLLAPVAITALLTRRAHHDRSDYLFYFVLDGLMMCSALLHLVLTIFAR